MSIIKYASLRIPAAIDLIQKEVLSLQADSWQLHYNKRDYEGDWTVLSLRSPGGDQNALAEPINGKEYADTALMEKCPAIKQVTDFLQCKKRSVRLLNLKARAIIKEHTDKELYFEKGEARLHIPVFTNEKVEFFLDNDRLVMQEGECWYINANLPHRLANKSNKDRIHLVVDCEVNEWLKDIFHNDCIYRSELGDDEIMERERDTIDKIIAELRRQTNNTTALEMADDLEKQLNGPKNKSDHSSPADIIISFIRSIGITINEERIESDTFLPGIFIRGGQLVFDRKKMLYPGDLLHEAGHIAVMLPALRETLNGNLTNTDTSDAEEMMAIAWSYAACIHLNIDPHIVFHEHGYKGSGDSIIENFKAGRFFGTPMLDWCGMSNDPYRNKDAQHVFPQMIKWMRE